MAAESSDALGLFGPGSLTWRLSRETALLLGGRRALLMQLAHPLVAQGVADHSDFQGDRLGRLLRTLDSSLMMVFGPRDEAQKTVAKINSVHRSVTGTLEEDVGAWREGTPYFAGNPQLLLWVHATLVDTSLSFYERFVDPLTDEEREQYYQETKWPVEALGVSPGVVPETHSDFVTYIAEMISSRQVVVGNVARRLARSILYPSPSPIAERLFDPLNSITIGTLPPPIREGYGLRWNPIRAAMLAGATGAVRRALPLLPKRVRFVSQARRAYRRVPRGD